jgi:uncharacterized protein YciI
MASERDQLIRQDYQRNTWLIQHTLEGLTHAESLLQPPFKANCVNWVLGHILAGRQFALEALGRPPFWDAATVARYRGGSPPITDGADARSFEAMLNDIAQSQTLLDEALDAAHTGRGAADLDRMVGEGQDRAPMWEHLAGRRWHETYHIGQLGILRQFILGRREQRSAAHSGKQFIYLFEAVRPELITGPDAWTERDNEIAEQHFLYLQRATEAGTVVLAGRSQDGVGPALVIVEVDSEEAARRFMEADPFVANGLMRARLHPYRAALVRKNG